MSENKVNVSINTFVHLCITGYVEDTLWLFQYVERSAVTQNTIYNNCNQNVNVILTD